ncbi:MAG: hypothetical protein QW184_01295 [Nanopusillaceae archaeon]
MNFLDIFKKFKFEYEIYLYNDETYLCINKTIVKKDLMFKIFLYILKKVNKAEYEDDVKTKYVMLSNNQDYIKILNNIGLAERLMNEVVKNKDYKYLSANIKNITFRDIDDKNVEITIEIEGIYTWRR